MAEAFLIDGVRTAQGRYGGVLAEVRADDLAGLMTMLGRMAAVSRQRPRKRAQHRSTRKAQP